MSEARIDHNALITNKKVKERIYWRARLDDFRICTYFNCIGGKNLHKYNDNKKEYSIKVATSIFNELEKIAKSDKAKHIVLLSALGVLLQKYSSISDVCIFNPIYSSIAKGFKIENNIVPVRMKDFTNLSFQEFIQVVKRDLYNDYINSNYQLDKLLNVEWEELEDLSLIGVMVDKLHSSCVYKDLPIDIWFSFQIGQGLELKIEFNSSKFDANYIQEVSERYLFLLNQLIINIKTKISNISLISKEESFRILNVFNSSNSDFSYSKTVIDIFEEKVSQYPHRVALVLNDKKITYEQLNKKSNQLAWLLKKKGIKSGSIVGLFVERSIEMIIGILGILKSGCTYLPIDINFPKNKINQLTSELQLQAILIKKGNINNSKLNSPNTIEIGEELDKFNESFDTFKSPKINENDIAYVLYTSGSTGKPKGALIKHKSIVNLILSLINIYKIKAKEIILQFSEYTFDPSVEQMFLSLCTGSTLVLIKNDVLLDKQEFNNYISNNSVTHLDVVPAYLDIVNSNVGSVKRMVVGGDICSIDHVRNWYKKLDFYNVYGLTETTVNSTVYHVKDIKEEQDFIPIGKPIGNTKVYILDKDNSLQPIGVPGEIYIGGAGVALGYIDSVELTHNRFIKNPLNKEEILYKTGDYAKWLPDGNIAFLGRKDFQLKIRGYRVELEEIEKNLLSHKFVKHAVVVARDDNNGEKFLCAYFVLKGFQANPIPNIKGYLSDLLPNYMVPTHYMELDGLPLSSNGKINRKALPEIVMDKEESFIAPTNEIESKLVEIWSEVLSIDADKVGVNSNFFDLGGNSLKIIIMNNMIVNQLGCHLTVGDIFRFSNISSLAKIIAEGNSKSEDLENSFDEREEALNFLIK